jgi:hypothetical protein
MSDSHPGKPAPSNNGPRQDKKKVPTKRPLDEEAIDFDEQSPPDGNFSGGLSFHVSRSGPLSGSSVMPWSELIKDQHDLGRELHRQESKKDAELLRDALAQEPPPSQVKEVIEEAKRPEKPAPVPADDDDDDFQLGPLANMDDASSIFGRAVGLRSDLSEPAWHESPEVDLLGNEQADHEDRTDELRRPNIDRTPQPQAKKGTGGVALIDTPEVEGSAVDLGSKPETDGLSSFVRQAQAEPPFRPRNGAVEAPPGHAPVDLLSAPSEVFDLATAGLAANRFDLALEEKPQSRRMVWAAACVFGLLVGAGTYATMWYSHALPDLTGSSQSKPVASAALQDAQDQARTTWLAQKAQLQGLADEAVKRAQKAQWDYDSLLAKLKTAKIDPADLEAVAVRLAREQAATDDARVAREGFAALTAALKSANLDPTDVPTALARLSQARAAAESAALQAEAQVARLRQEAAGSARHAKAAEEQLRTELVRLALARASLADFQADVVSRLKAVGAISNETHHAEFIAALDAALQRHAGSSPRPNAASAERDYGHGRELYRSGDYHAAEQAFDASIKANERDARYLYFRGLCRWQQGRTEEAGRDFARAAKLERQSLPNPREIDFALERVQGGPRQVLNRYRP